MMKKIELKQEDYPDMDFNKIIDIPSVKSEEGKLIIELKLKE